ncbi:hypothetical protein [Paraglaciecola marina]|uniref:hypothetical protein n=1 Tax=Paraglaciecola marina TaxID=2500157 RepID=UPI001EF06558|nr:hypothetical protein [Paraglaciecola marina]
MNTLKYGCLISLFFSSFLFAANIEIHQHQSREIGSGIPIPKIELTAFRDVIDGVNIHVSIANYVLSAPDLATKSVVSNEGFLQGHAHVFVNGSKRQRLYGSDIHIPQSWLKDGVNQVAISLNSHAHENWVSNEHNIVGSIFLDLSKEQFVLHNFTSQPIKSKHAHH